MFIRPIDSFSVLQRTSELQRSTATSREQHQQAQHHFMQELQQVSAREQQIVRQSEDTKKNELEQNPNQKKKRQLEQKAKRPKVGRGSSPEEDGTRGKHLDIKA